MDVAPPARLNPLARNGFLLAPALAAALILAPADALGDDSRAALFDTPWIETPASGGTFADFNEDGRPDLVAVIDSDRLSIRMGAGGGHFAAATEWALPYTPYAPFSPRLAVADFDADGHLDLAVSTSDQVQGAVTLYSGAGDDTFSPPVTYDVALRINAITAADLDRDGLPELILAGAERESNIITAEGNRWIGFVQVLANDGQGELLPPIRYPSGEFEAPGPSSYIDSFLNFDAGPNALAVADLDGDGRLDLAIASGLQDRPQRDGGGLLSVLHGDGSGGFQAPVMVGDGTSWLDVAAADLNEDGHPDLIAYNVSNQGGPVQFDLLLADGAGGFAEPRSVTAPYSSYAPNRMTVSDLNGDDHLDLAFADRGLFIALGDGTGAFPDTDALSLTYPTSTLRVADLNGDGRNDLLLASPFNGVVLFNDGDLRHPFQLPSYGVAVGPSPYYEASGDFNGDGHPDVVVTHYDPGSSLPTGNPLVSLLTGDGLGGLTLAGSWEMGTRMQDLAAADLDGDGHLDLITADPAGTLVLRFGDGAGAFSAPTTLPLAGQPNGLAVGDVNRDGRPDLIAALAQPGIALLLNDGSRSFAPAALVVEDLSGYFSSVALGDFNGDGAADIAATIANAVPVPFAGRMILLSGDGAGGFQTAASVDLEREPRELRALDFDGDGALDLLSLNNYQTDDNLNNREIVLLPGNGDGSFGAPLTLADSAGAEQIITAFDSADFDGDGHLDLAYTWGGGVRILFGDGARGTAGQADFLTASDPSRFLATDLNHDGAADLACVLGFTSSVSVMLNQRAGTTACPRATLTADLATLHLPRVTFPSADGPMELAAELERASGFSELTYRVSDVEFLGAAGATDCDLPSLSQELTLSIPELFYLGGDGARFEVELDERMIDSAHHFLLRSYHLLESM
ncbi:FG-GAP repeat domain-containing protein [Endothiovibrio diazotrophicus]